MKSLYRSSPVAQTGKTRGKLTQLGAVAGVASLMILVHAALHIIAPVSLLLLQLSPDVCQACVTILRICGE